MQTGTHSHILRVVIASRRRRQQNKKKNRDKKTRIVFARFQTETTTEMNSPLRRVASVSFRFSPKKFIISFG